MIITQSDFHSNAFSAFRHIHHLERRLHYDCYFIRPRVTPLYYLYSNEPSICDAFDYSHVKTSVIPYISLDLYLTPNLYTIPNMQNMRFFFAAQYTL